MSDNNTPRATGEPVAWDLATVDAVAACAVLVLALGHLVSPLLTCSAGCGHYEQEMRR